MPGSLPHVLILGAGFAGLNVARSLRRAPVRVTVIDRANHHLFQPLLYQVATASLSPAEIATPIRTILRRQKNADVLLAEAVSIDVDKRTVRLTDGEVSYDWLVIATGAGNAYFGHDQWAALAPGLKTIPDALAIRERFLLAFERAEREPDPAARRAILTFLVIGGGPTGVELAGAMAEIARRAMPSEFRSIDTTTARVILIEGSDRLLGTFPPALSRRAKDDLERLGVDVWLSTRVTNIDKDGVELGHDRITTRNVFWAAGVTASPVVASLPGERDRGGRVKVLPDLTLPGHPGVFVLGDLAWVEGANGQGPVPGVAPAAMQMGKYAGRVIAREIQAPSAGSVVERRAFRYSDRGTLATIGRARAVGTVWSMPFSGFVAWVLWLVIHILFLIGFRNRVIVLIQWVWAYFTYQRGSRIITSEVKAEKEPALTPVSPGAPATTVPD